MKHVQTITFLLFFAFMGLSGCDQAKELATEAAEKAKQDVAAEISNAIKGEDQAEKEGSESSKDAEKQDDDKKSAEGEK